MYRRYAAQARVETFRELLNSIPSVGTIWDDHDFAWNNSCSAGRGDNVVPSDKKRIARGLLLQFRKWARSCPLPNAYPAKPSIQALLAGPDSGIEEVFGLDSVRFIMLDGRYYREPKIDEESGMMLGTAQREWLSEQLRGWPGISVIASGTTLSRGKESEPRQRVLGRIQRLSLTGAATTAARNTDVGRYPHKRRREAQGPRRLDGVLRLRRGAPETRRRQREFRPARHHRQYRPGHPVRRGRYRIKKKAFSSRPENLPPVSASGPRNNSRAEALAGVRSLFCPDISPLTWRNIRDNSKRISPGLIAAPDGSARLPWRTRPRCRESRRPSPRPPGARYGSPPPTPWSCYFPRQCRTASNRARR